MKTNREYLEALLIGFGIEDNGTLEAFAEGAGLELDEPLNVKACDLAMYEQIGFIIARSGHNISEGGYSISWNLDALKLFYRSLCLKLGKTNRLETKGTGKVRWRSL